MRGINPDEPAQPPGSTLTTPTPERSPDRRIERLHLVNVADADDVDEPATDAGFGREGRGLAETGERNAEQAPRVVRVDEQSEDDG